MFRRQRKVKKYRRPGRSLIASKEIKPDEWKFSDAEIKEALKVKGCDVKQVKTIRYLKHQVCIAFWDAKGNVCSSFFSYRIFARWQTEVEKIIYYCPTLDKWQNLNSTMQYEFAYYDYISEMSDVLSTALENRLYVLKATELAAVFYDV
ncbi:hypothetical protein [Nodularia sphaerocarpa]|uniref:hypothetical protein n=1 Tax=Nodularia sphaerocarpa TaxID=137816 RepID=UPI001EFB668C|nr:hypothetical protein [Nodularia sphaerocarpa]MDB9373691.1 hypothetical protein [Nodularia sphaerocarpa CS-585]MDB9379948.1 hypothetical protein [Nodularia sphaerocarpa CS-585A2]ULP73001.1 hypothetical protein BDGGKGIB_02653 [Nodularia sphaerocarpa UHCC 0038]